MTRYYAREIGPPPPLIYRLSDDHAISDGWHYKEKKWVYAPHLAAALSGFSSDDANYTEITEQEANALIAAQPAPAPGT